METESFSVSINLFLIKLKYKQFDHIIEYCINPKFIQYLEFSYNQSFVLLWELSGYLVQVSGKEFIEKDGIKILNKVIDE